MDRKWIDHIDDMDNLRTGIGLRGYGNKNPVIVYQAEGFDMFDEMISSMRKDVANFMMGIHIQVGLTANQIVQMRKQQKVSNLKTNAGGDIPATVTKKKEPGRNDPCPCGSGKKYKNCCGKNQ